MTRTPKHIHPVRRLLIAALVAISSGSSHAGETSDSPDMHKAAELANKTLERLGRQPAAWTAVFDVSGKGKVVVTTTWTPESTRWSLVAEAGAARTEYAMIIERDGLWYVRGPGRQPAKYRPLEAPLFMPNAYLFLLSSGLYVVDNPAAFSDFQLVEQSGRTATFRMPPSEQRGTQMRDLLQTADKLSIDVPPGAEGNGYRRALENARDYIASGTQMSVDLDTGLITRRRTPGFEVQIEGFRWLDAVDERTFDVNGTTWADHTLDPTAGDLNDLIMIGHAPMWRPGTPKFDPNGCLLNLKTGELRRIPYDGANCQTGCFSRDRTRLYVSGWDPEVGAFLLTEVDLKTGDNRVLGGPNLRFGFTMMPTLSHDGRTLAVLHKETFAGDSVESALSSQVYVVDIASGDSRRVGEPLDTAFLSWLPEDQGLLLITREHGDPEQPATATISRMDLEGRITPIRKGDDPVLLPDKKTILFQDQQTRLWNLCDLDGGNVRLLADGLPRHGFPAPSPDGKQLIMMRFGGDRAPVPVILTFGASEGRPITSLPGLWAYPAWR